MEETQIKKVLKNRLEREIKIADERKIPEFYIMGYREAINNINWDLFKELPM